MVLFENIEDIFQHVRDFSDCSKAIVTLVTAIGSITTIFYSLKLILNSLQGIRLYVCSQICCKADFIKRYGQWAVISGATDGIGKSMAIELAKRGHSIIVLGRNEQKLADTKSRLEEEVNVGKVLTIKIDLSDSSLQNFENIRGLLDVENRDIGILINNAGLFPSRYTLFVNHKIENLRDMVNVNVMAPVYLTRMIMPSMLKRGRGLILNVSSGLGSVSAPYTSIYGSTKSFLDRFSWDLQAECYNQPIDVINLKPGPVHTKLLTTVSKMSKPSLMNPSADDFSKTAINALSARIGTYAGVMMHGLLNCTYEFFDGLGLIPILMRFQARTSTKNPNFSVESEEEQNAENA